MNWYDLARPWLFRIEPEKAHKLALKALPWLPNLGVKLNIKPVEVMGLMFSNPIGLAAGFDKNGAYSDQLFKLGFGFIEIGTLTPKAQLGNPSPRLFRLPEDHALINRMGFNNQGIEHYLEHYTGLKRPGVLGINIGKNKSTPMRHAVNDYTLGFHQVYPHADYITVNVSSPNTPGLRQLEQGDFLNQLCTSLKETQKKCQDIYQKHVPLVVKLSPDLELKKLDETVALLSHHQVDGIIATNTTISREHLVSSLRRESGGVSGLPVKTKSTETIRFLFQRLQGQIPIIGVGGILQAQDALEKLEAGASLVQIYTGLIYKGPGFTRRLLRELYSSQATVS